MARVEIDRLTKRYPNGVTALDAVSLVFEPGEVVAVLGRSGAGKSTLLRSINGLETPTSGEVRVGGVPVQKATLRPVRKRVGMVFQQFNLVPRLSVMANVLTGRLGQRGMMASLLFAFPAEDFALATAALNRVGLSDRAWDRVEKLSGGQQQRVAIARTLVQDPEVVLADEPVASLDPSISQDVMTLLVDLAREKDRTLILNLHQVELAQAFADRVVGLRQGGIVFDLPASSLTADRIADLYGQNAAVP